MMIKKNETAFQISDKVWGTKVTYRLFGLLIFQKTVFPPKADELEWFR